MRLSDSPAFGALTEREVTVDGLRIRYTESGEGPPLLLLHGAIFAGNAFWWETQSALAPRVRSLAPDFPGWGASDRPHGPYSMEFYHRFIDGFLDALGLAQVAIAGHSMGGLLASSYALLHPDRVCALATVAVPPVWVEVELPELFHPFLVPMLGEAMLMLTPLLGIHHPMGIRRYYASLFHDPARIPEGRLQDVLEEGCRLTADPAHRHAFISTFRANMPLFSRPTSREFASQLTDLRLPITLIAGRDDPLFPVARVEEAAGLLPGARLEILERCGHFPMWEHPAQVSHLLAELAGQPLLVT